MVDKVQEIKDKAFNLLSYRDRSIYELKERLLQKGYLEKDILKVIDRLKELDYLNDRRFAFNWVKYRIKNRPRGKLLLKKELMEKGISEEIINDALNNLYDYELEKGIADKLAKKWLNSHSMNALKLKRYLYNKGFTIDIIYKIINNIGKDNGQYKKKM
ncbi:regulatory protein RecX [Natronospora cellulosivora (SeqCode)]